MIDTDAPGNRRSITQDVLQSVGECVYEWDLEQDVLEWNEGAATLLCTSEEAISSNRKYSRLLLSSTLSSRDDTIISSEEKDTGNGVPFRLKYALSGAQLGTQSDIWVEECGRWFANEAGKPARAHGVIRIINERRSLEERLDRLSRFDALTGLYNRSHLKVCLDELFERGLQHDTGAAFVIVGLENFDIINSVYGFDAGDAVIEEIARRLKGNLRDNDTLGRFSGAKIGLILPECSETDLQVAGERILSKLRESVVQTENGPVAVTISIGAVLMPAQARNSREAFMAAHEALLESRRARDFALISYRRDPAKDEKRRQAAGMADQIVKALRQGRVHLAYQPIVDAGSSRVAFHEALIRLETEDGGAFTAANFVETAQHLGLIRLVDHHALDLALTTLVKYPMANFSLNVSNETACDPEWLAKVGRVVKRNPDVADRLIVEITESHAAESLSEAKRFVQNVKDMGCQIALDDFGAGFTSFRNLKSLDFDIIKVDGQFVDDLKSCHENQMFIRSLVQLARLFNAKTVVEWVEDDETATMLANWGVDYLQGYRFGQPKRHIEWMEDLKLEAS